MVRAGFRALSGRPIHPMKTSVHPVLSFLFAIALPISVAATVTITEDTDLYTLDNGIVTARVAKASGDLVSLRYKNQEMLGTFLKPDGTPDLERDPPGHNPHGLNRNMT